MLQVLHIRLFDDVLVLLVDRARLVVEQTYRALDVADRKLLLYDLLRQREHLFGVLQAKQRTRVSRAQAACTNKLEHLVGKIQKTEHVRNGRAALADLLGYLLLRQIKPFDQHLIRKRFLQGVEILSLYVLDYSNLCRLEIVTLQDDCRDLAKTCHLGSSPTALTR